jgi:hypothetical protein
MAAAQHRGLSISAAALAERFHLSFGCQRIPGTCQQMSLETAAPPHLGSVFPSPLIGVKTGDLMAYPRNLGHLTT